MRYNSAASRLRGSVWHPWALVLQLLHARGALLNNDLLRGVRTVNWSAATKLRGLVGITKLFLSAFSSSVQGQGEQARPITHLRHEVNVYSESGVDRALASTAMMLQSFMSALNYRNHLRWVYTGLCRSEQRESHDAFCTTLLSAGM